MSTRTLVWAYKPLPQLDHQCYLVECDEALALELIAAGEVQDPREGALHLRYVDTQLQAGSPPSGAHEYHTTQLTPARGTRRRS